MSEQEDRPHWNEIPEYHSVYMPWGDALIQSEAVRKIKNKIEADKTALAESGARMLPDLNRLSCTVAAEIDGENRDYLVRYSAGDSKIPLSEDTITITYVEGDHSIMLNPDRTSGYKIGMSLGTKPGVHPLLGSGHTYSPYPFIDQPELMDYAQQVVEQVAAKINE